MKRHEGGAAAGAVTAVPSDAGDTEMKSPFVRELKARRNLLLPFFSSIRKRSG